MAKTASVIVAFKDGVSVDTIRSLATQDYKDYQVFYLTGHAEGQDQVIGVNRAEGDIILFTNSDCILPPDWVSRMTSKIEGGYDIVGGLPFNSGDAYNLAWNQPKTRKFEKLGIGFSTCAVSRRWLEKHPLQPFRRFTDGIFVFGSMTEGARVIQDRSIVIEHRHPLGSCKASFLKSYTYERGLCIISRLTFGKTVGGAIGLSSFNNQAREWLCIDGVRAWKDWNLNVCVSLPRFLFYRLFAFKLGSLYGLISGLLLKSPELNDIAVYS